MLGRQIPVRSVRPGEPVPGLPEAAWGVAAGMDMDDTVVDMTELVHAFGIKLTSVEEFVRSSLAGAVA